MLRRIFVRNLSTIYFCLSEVLQRCGISTLGTENIMQGPNRCSKVSLGPYGLYVRQFFTHIVRLSTLRIDHVLLFSPTSTVPRFVLIRKISLVNLKSDRNCF